MRTFTLGFLFVSAASGAMAGSLDLATLGNYSRQPIPPYITRDNTPADNPISDAGATLGRVLFHDKRLSRNDTVSCSSCHSQDRAFGDSATASTGVNGTTGRHAMRLVNARFSQEARFFWDERASTAETQSTQPIKDHVEMGFSGENNDPAFADLVNKLGAIPEYRVLFAMVFEDAALTETQIQKALAQFVRSIQSFDSKYDQGRAQVAGDGQNFPNFTAAENAGKQLFLNPPQLGGAGCAGCHRPPEFDIDPNSRNNGVITSLSGGTDLTNTRAPSLRDSVGPSGQSNGPFMHNGSLAGLDAVVQHYSAIPGDNANLDPRLRRPGGVQSLNLTRTQRENLVAFLGTLTGSVVYTDARWSDPFSADGKLELIVLPAAALSIQDAGNGTGTLRARAAANLPYQLQSSNDLQTWTPVESLLSSDDGLVETLVPFSGPRFYRLVFTPPQ